MACTQAADAATALPAGTPAGLAAAPVLGKAHARRLREIYRSAGWPCHDALEIDLIAAGMLQRLPSASGPETLRVSDSGMQWLAQTLQRNRAAMSAHEALVEQVAQAMCRAGRIAWRGLSVRAQVPTGDEAQPLRWAIARPDVFSIRNTSVEAYAEPIVHEVKVRRADLLGDLRVAAKRAAYLDLGECWYVLGNDARGRPIASADEIPAECGVMLLQRGRLEVARPARKAARAHIPFGVWMALAKATPVANPDDDAQGLLGGTDDGLLDLLLQAPQPEPERLPEPEVMGPPILQRQVAKAPDAWPPQDAWPPAQQHPVEDAWPPEDSWPPAAQEGA